MRGEFGFMGFKIFLFFVTCKVGEILTGVRVVG